MLVVSQYYWPEGFRINDVTRSLVDRGIHVDVLTGKPNYPGGRIYDGYRLWGCESEEFHGVQINRVPLIPRGKNSKVQLAINYLSFIFFGLIIGPWLERGKRYDVVFVYGLSPLLLAIPALFIGWIKKAPVIIWVQDLWPQSLSATGYIRNRWLLWLVELAVRFIYRHADMILVQSQAFIKPVGTLAGDTPVEYYPNSVDPSFALPAINEPPDVAGLGTDFSVMFAGNIGRAQAVEVIVDAAIRLKDYEDIQFVVLGDGSRREWMLQQVAEFNLNNLHLPGRFPVETMPGFMQKASALLVTLSDQEIFAYTVPNKVQAYMAAGRPIIACLPGEGVRLVEEAGAGIGVQAEDGEALAAAILQLYKMPYSAREEMGRKGRAYFYEFFDHEKLVDQLISHLQAVINKKRGQ